MTETMTLSDFEPVIGGKNHSEILSMKNSTRSNWYKRILPEEKEEAMGIVSIVGRAKISTAWTLERKAELSVAMTGENNPAKRPEVRAKISAAKTGKNHPMYGKTRPEEVKAKISAALTGRILSEEHKAKISGENNPMYGKTLTKETKAKISAFMIERWKDPEYRANLSAINTGESNAMYGKIGKNSPFFGKTHTEETKAKISVSMSGENNPSFNNWSSREPYCHLWNEPLREKIRNRDNRVCVLCGKGEIQNGQRLSVHHINSDKMQGCGDWEWKLTALCHSCHGRMNRQENHVLLQLLLVNNKKLQINFLFGG